MSDLGLVVLRIVGRVAVHPRRVGGQRDGAGVPQCRQEHLAPRRHALLRSRNCLAHGPFLGARFCTVTPPPRWMRPEGDTGIRCAELSALDLADCDLPRGRLLIRHGKGNKQRVVPFARRCRAALEAYLAVRGRTPGPLLWAVTGPSQLRTGVRLQPNGLKQLLRRRGRAAHVPRCHAHRFRHTFADLGHPAGRPRTRRPALARPRRPRDRAPLHRQLPRRGRRPPPRPLLARRSDAQAIPVRRTRAPLAPPSKKQPVLALKLHCSFLSRSTADRRSANRLQMLPKQRVVGSSPFSRVSRSRRATVASSVSTWRPSGRRRKIRQGSTPKKGP